MTPVPSLNLNDTGQSIWCLLNNIYPCYGQSRSDSPTAVGVQGLLIVGAIALAVVVVADGIRAWRARRREEA